MAKAAQKEQNAPEALDVASSVGPAKDVRTGKLDPKRFAPAEEVRVIWRATLDSNQTLEDVMRPDFWSHCVGRRPKVGDLIEIVCDTQAFSATLYVRDVGPQWLSAVFWSEPKTHETIKPMEGLGGFVVDFKGPHLKFCVVRVSDKAVLKDKCATQAEALSWIAAEQRTRAA
jgi:hypothetical protein